MAALRDQVAQRLNFDLFTLQNFKMDQNGDDLTAGVTLGGQAVTLRLELHSMRSPNFQLLLQQDASGDLTPAEAPPVATYDGTVDEMPGARVAASYTGGLLNAIVQSADERYIIQPAADLGVANPGQVHVVYRAADIPAGGRTCAVTPEDEAKALAQQVQQQEGQRRISGTGLTIAEIAIDGDFSYFQEEGSVAACISKIETVMNGVRLDYEVPAISMTFEISVIVIRTNSNDPYTSSNASVLLDQFQDTWNSSPYSAVPRDCAQLFTGINLTPPPIGIAFISTGCNTSMAYSVIEINAVFTTNERIALSSHELGHIWGGAHCDGCASCTQCCRIMCSGLGGCSGIITNFGCFSENQIGNYVGNVSCDSPLPPPTTVPFCEQWTSPAIDVDRWLFNKGGLVNGAATNIPSSPFAIELDASGSNEVQRDELRSNYIDLSGESNVVLSYFTEAQGVEAGEKLVVEVRLGNKTWFPVNTITSNGANQSQFVFHSHVLPAAAHHEEARIRFRTEVDGSSDNWFIDDISLDCLPPPVCDEPCDDGEACTVNDNCVSEFNCSGDPVDCSGVGGNCTVASCDPIGAEGNCDIETPVEDGGACNAGAGFCSGGTCLSASNTGRIFLAGMGDQGSVNTGGPTSMLMGAGGTVQVGVFMDENSPPGQLLNAYQIILPMQATPIGDAMGTVSYVDVNPGQPTGNTIFIDTARGDWVFAGQVVLPINYNETPGLGIFGVFYSNPQGVGVDPSTLPGIRYLADFDLEASADANGQFEVRFNLAPADPPHTQLYNQFGGGYTIEQTQPLLINVGQFDCLDIADCGDVDMNGVRDDPCTWYGCNGGTCLELARTTQADMGGFSGACPPDTTCDGNDRFHALNCFSNISTSGSPPYPCEPDPPSAINVDAGSPASCVIDGVCDGNDAFHALNCFENDWFDGTPGYECGCAGPQPAVVPVVPPRAVSSGLTLRAGESARRGDLVDVDVLLTGDVEALRGYQLHLGVSGGTQGAVELVDITVDSQRADYVFAGAPGAWMAFNRSASQMVVGMDAAQGLPAHAGAYLATFTYKVSAAAAGTFVIDVRYDGGSLTPQDRTFLFGRYGAPLEVGTITPAHISVLGERGRSVRVGAAR
jgi:hypothetical protein